MPATTSSQLPIRHRAFAETGAQRARCIVIPSGARNLTVEVGVTQSNVCEATTYVRSFTSLRMTRGEQCSSDSERVRELKASANR
jgi:hypothetical protein